MSLTRLKKDKTLLFIDTDSTGSTPDWARIGKSTVFDLTMNANTEENNFIEDETPTTEVLYYAPTMDQELQCNKGDDAFDFMYDMFFNLPTGEDTKKTVLVVFAGNIGSESETKFNAWESTATLTLDHFDSVAEKIYFNIAFNTITRGTATVTSGVPTFTAN